MESLARLVAMIYLTLWLLVFCLEFYVVYRLISIFFSNYGGCWYIVWFLLTVAISWFTVLIMIKLIIKLKG